MELFSIPQGKRSILRLELKGANTENQTGEKGLYQQPLLSWHHCTSIQVSGSNDFDVKVWSYTTLLHHIRGQKSTVTSLSFKRGCIVSGAASGYINVWSQKGVLITSLSVPKHRVNCCDLSVVMKSKDDTVDLDPGML